MVHFWHLPLFYYVKLWHLELILNFTSEILLTASERLIHWLFLFLFLYYLSLYWIVVFLLNILNIRWLLGHPIPVTKIPWPTLPAASLWSNVSVAAVIMFSSPSKWTPTLKGMEQEQIVLWSWAVAVVENQAPQIFSFPVAAPVVVGVAGA